MHPHFKIVYTFTHEMMYRCHGVTIDNVYSKRQQYRF